MFGLGGAHSSFILGSQALAAYRKSRTAFQAGPIRCIMSYALNTCRQSQDSMPLFIFAKIRSRNCQTNFYMQRLTRKHDLSFLSRRGFADVSKGPETRLRNRMFERLSFFLKRFRPWRADDFVALFSWIFLGHTLFFILGTTAFVSSLLFLADSLQFQGVILLSQSELSLTLHSRIRCS